MKITYRDCDITAVRDRSLADVYQIYWDCFSADGYEITSGFGMYGTVREAIRELKKVVDSFIDQYKRDEDRWESRKDEA